MVASFIRKSTQTGVSFISSQSVLHGVLTDISIMILIWVMDQSMGEAPQPFANDKSKEQFYSIEHAYELRDNFIYFITNMISRKQNYTFETSAFMLFVTRPLLAKVSVDFVAVEVMSLLHTCPTDLAGKSRRTNA